MISILLKIKSLNNLIFLNSVDVTAVFSARAGIQKLGRRLTILPIEIKVRMKFVVKSCIKTESSIYNYVYIVFMRYYKEHNLNFF